MILSEANVLFKVTYLNKSYPLMRNDKLSGSDWILDLIKYTSSHRHSENNDNYSYNLVETMYIVTP